jgi:hypothetical protein
MRVVINQRGLNYMMSPVGPVGRAAARAAGRIRDRAKENATVDTGLMRNSIIAGQVATASPRKIQWRIGTAVHYAIHQELGVGPIFARRAPYLVFKVGNRWVTTYQTKGVPAAKFLTRAINDVTSADFRGGTVQ